MSKTRFIRSTILRYLKNDRNFDGMVTAEFNGKYFYAADIALPNNENHCQVFRIIVVKHGTS